MPGMMQRLEISISGILSVHQIYLAFYSCMLCRGQYSCGSASQPALVRCKRASAPYDYANVQMATDYHDK